MSAATLQAPPALKNIPAHWQYDPNDYWEKGYAIARGVFSPAEMKEIHAATDRVKKVGMDRGTGFRHGNMVFWVNEDPNIGTNVRGMQWSSYIEPLLDQVRKDPRMLAIIEPLIGNTARQIINQLHWKTPGSKTAIEFHADRRNRLPAAAFRDVANSYVQTAIAVDPMTDKNGALMIVPGSHRKPFLEDPLKGANFSQDESYRNLNAMGYSKEDLMPMYAEPGDVLLWHVDTIHGSGINRDPHMDRCIYINGYVKAQNCMRGHWAFIKGQPVPLPPIDVPVLIQHEPIFDDLTDRNEQPPKKLYD